MIMGFLLLFIDCFLLWLLLTWTVHTHHIIIGIIISLIISSIFYKKFSKTPTKWFNPLRYIFLICYLPFFAWECIKANIDVAYRVLHPKMPIKPGIVKVKTRLKSNISKIILANSITMTPGTISVDIKDEYLYIHWIWVRSEDVENATKYIVKKFEPLLMKIFE